MKTLFWLLDINSWVTEKGPEIRLWGVDDTAHRVVILDRNFLPYFYLLLEETADSKDVIRDVLKKAVQSIVDVHEVVDKKYFGKPVKAIKIVCSDPDAVLKQAASLSKIRGVQRSLEADIRYSSRYLIDNEVNPCGWHIVDVEQIENDVGLKAEKVYLAKSRPRAVEQTHMPSLRILSFSMVCYSVKGSPKPEKSPIIVISTFTNDGASRQFVAEDGNDRPLIEAFIKSVQAFDPDLIVGYGTNTFEWPYLLKRVKTLGLKLQVDRSGGEPHRSVYGHISVTGRANVDLYDLADEIPEVKVKTLETLADYLRVGDVGARLVIETIDIPNYWDDQDKHPTLLKFSSRRTRDMLGVADAMLDFAMQLANLVGLPLDHVGTAAVGFRTEAYLIRQAYHLHELIPPRVEQPYFPYQGAIVMKPKPGIYELVDALDFKSMYPNLMIANNISPDTYLAPNESLVPLSEVNVAPELGYRFRKTPTGFYGTVLVSLIADRDELRKKLKGFSPQETAFKILDARQRAVKVLTNATYGYAGWVGARWYVHPVAEATAAWGRATITRAMALAKKVGLAIIYSDTDSIFVKHDPVKVETLIDLVQRELGLEIRPDKFYERLFFTEAKKRYAGLLPDGTLDIVGLEVARGDWTTAAKQVQEGVLEKVLKENSSSKAVAFVKQYIQKLRLRAVPCRDLIIWKTLTKKPSAYKVSAAHVEAAKLLMKAGWELNVGEQIGFVITKGKGKLFERAKPYSMTQYDSLDIEYYVSQQVIPAALRILSIFHVSETDLKP